jgi:hypothetical protein
MRRAWPDVLREMKATRPMASKALLDTEVDLDGDVLVVEFAPNRRTPMAAASEQDAVALLRECIRRVTGATLAVRFQAGRGVVRHDVGVEADAPDHEAAAVDETTGDAASPAPATAGNGRAADGPATDAARVLIDGLGAEVVDDGRTTAPGKRG